MLIDVIDSALTWYYLSNNCCVFIFLYHCRQGVATSFKDQNCPTTRILGRKKKNQEAEGRLFMFPILLVLVSVTLTEYVLFAVTLFLGMNSLWRCFPETDLSCFTAHAQVLHSSPSGLHTPWENRDITHNKTPNRVGHWTIFFCSGIRRPLCQRKFPVHVLEKHKSGFLLMSASTRFFIGPCPHLWKI